MIKMNGFTAAKAAMMLLALSSLAPATTFTFNTDPFQGTTIRSIPGRQIVGGELFLSFNTASDTFAFDEAAFGMGNQIHFANGQANAIPSTGLNVVVLEDLDNDATAGTPFGAGNAADLLASRITDSGPGVFIYFNSSLNLPRLVYSSDLGSNTADLVILARMLNLTGQTGINALPTFSASNFAINESQAAVPEPSGMALMCGGIALLVFPAIRRVVTSRMAGTAAILCFVAVAHAADVTNIVDTTGDFRSFGFMPAISNSGAVAFTARGVGNESGAVFRWQAGQVTVIASKDSAGLTGFGETVVLNSAGVVGFGAKVLADNDSIIGAGDGGPIHVIASAAANGLVGGGFLGVSGINESGSVVFLAFRKFFRSQAIFEGQGGPLLPVVDTATNPNFTRLGNPAINASGRVAFVGFTDTSEGLFTVSQGAITNVVASESDSPGFLDPVINNSGMVGSAAALHAGAVEIFTVNGGGLNVVTNPPGYVFSFVDNVSVNNSGDLVFFGDETSGRDSIFIKGKQDSYPVPLIATGDALFGSQVTRLSIGRYALNDRDQVVFLYGLQDGRSGLAIASRQPGRVR